MVWVFFVTLLSLRWGSVEAKYVKMGPYPAFEVCEAARVAAMREDAHAGPCASVQWSARSHHDSE